MRQFQPSPGHTDYPQWQAPKYPPQSGTNSLPQQFLHPLSGLPQGQPQTPKRNPRKRLSIAALVVVVIVVALSVATFVHGSQPMSTPRPIAGTTHPASQSTPASHSAPTLGDTSIYERTVKLANGYDKVYFSAALAGLFPASAFTGPNGNQVKAGLFDVQYIYRSGTIIDSCGILIGTEQTQL